MITISIARDLGSGTVWPSCLANGAIVRLGEPASQVPALRVVGGQGECLAVALRGLVLSAEPAQQVSPGGWQQVVPGQARRRGEVPDQCQPGLRAVAHLDGARAVP